MSAVNYQYTIFISGLEKAVTENNLRNAFETFGEIVDIHLPRDYEGSESHRGYAFIEFETAEEATSAIDNMDYSELLGKVIRVTIAKIKRIADYKEITDWDGPFIDEPKEDEEKDDEEGPEAEEEDTQEAGEEDDEKEPNGGEVNGDIQAEEANGDCVEEEHI